MDYDDRWQRGDGIVKGVDAKKVKGSFQSQLHGAKNHVSFAASLLLSKTVCKLLLGKMRKFLKNIARYLVTGFLLIAVSGFTITIHHEHSIGNSAARNENVQRDGLVLKTTPQTYHEVHIVKLLSGDRFNGSQKIVLKISPLKLFTVQLESPQFSSDYHFTSVSTTDIKGTGPPSVDKCVLFCSFLL